MGNQQASSAREAGPKPKGPEKSRRLPRDFPLCTSLTSPDKHIILLHPADMNLLQLAPLNIVKLRAVLAPPSRGAYPGAAAQERRARRLEFQRAGPGYTCVAVSPADSVPRGQIVANETIWRNVAGPNYSEHVLQGHVSLEPDRTIPVAERISLRCFDQSDQSQEAIRAREDAVKEYFLNVEGLRRPVTIGDSFVTTGGVSGWVQSVHPNGSAVVVPTTVIAIDEVSRDLAPDLLTRLQQAAMRQMYGYRMGPYGREVVVLPGNGNGLSLQEFGELAVVRVPEGHPEDDLCSICYCEMEVGQPMRVLPNCAHTFHKDCIDAWFIENATCPECRQSCRVKNKELMVPR